MPKRSITLSMENFCDGPEGIEQLRRACTTGIRAVLACQSDRLNRDDDADTCIFLVYLLEATFSNWRQPLGNEEQ